jgi:hypothetical protein
MISTELAGFIISSSGHPFANKLSLISQRDAPLRICRDEHHEHFGWDIQLLQFNDNEQITFCDDSKNRYFSMKKKTLNQSSKNLFHN